MTTASAPPGVPSMTTELQAHLSLCEEVLEVVTRESEALRGKESFAGQDFSSRRNALLPRLTQSLDSLRRIREARLKMDPATRAAQGETEALIRRNQDLIMKIIVLDRENEQLLLRRGLIPLGQLPASARQRPHAVAEQYLRHCAS